MSGSRTFKYSDLVVKLAFTEENQEKLRHEYTIYRHLAAIGFTENILRVYGLFQDAETGVLAIVMDYGGNASHNSGDGGIQRSALYHRRKVRSIMSTSSTSTVQRFIRRQNISMVRKPGWHYCWAAMIPMSLTIASPTSNSEP